MTNLDALIEAEVIPEAEKGNISAHNLQVIASLTAEEVESIISIFNKVGKKTFFEEMYCHAAFF